MSFHVRRKEREITDQAELQSILKNTKYVTIALCKDNEPYLVALNHGYDQQHSCLYFHCANEGKKLVYAQANSRVWGQAVLDFGLTDECDYAYTCVHFSGVFSLVTDRDEKWHGLQVLVRQVALNPESKLAKIKPEKVEKLTIAKIDINYMSGKKHQILPKA
ncbi:MAG: pyridoxamine 5'-phosphate oxidase family protein [Candidatus Bathyarchaeia archaeon]|jgi:nitroimidazol reductase NimA-like FMN-containing flavoprotein (pyridoxamine 5'-phosphate oxidase superfamily)